jgi:uncharacterized protein (DUF1800 family)
MKWVVVMRNLVRTVEVMRLYQQSCHTIVIGMLLLISLSACGGGSSSSEPEPPPVVVTPPPPIEPPKTVLAPAEASAFLNRATFGATRGTIDALVTSNIEDWLEDQYNKPVTRLLPYVQSLDEDQVFPVDRVEGWWLNVVNGEDQLRQRLAFALSEIFVISDQNGFLFNNQEGVADYYDMLAENAFGNYRELLEDVTLHPAMGIYLSMLGNQKPDPVNNIRPDENYAREIMQLFSIGLVELNIDGSPILDADGKPVPTYNQDIIEGFAHVFTGWNFAGTVNFYRPPINFLEPMQPRENFHDKGEKQLINDIVVPAGQTAREDLAIALDALFNHPNVGPFMSYRLIQRLVTSNPSPGYIQRVAETFNDNGQGVRGDLWAVVKAILTDEEALEGYNTSPTTFGKLREPLIRMAHQFRVTGAKTAEGGIPFGFADFILGQSPQRSPSVFNFFSPDYQQPGEILEADLVAPEFEIATANNMTGMHNAVLYFLYVFTERNNDNRVYLELDDLVSLADDHTALLDELDLIYMAGQMTETMRAEIIDYLDFITPYVDAQTKVVETTFLILTSSEYAIQK